MVCLRIAEIMIHNGYTITQSYKLQKSVTEKTNNLRTCTIKLAN